MSAMPSLSLEMFSELARNTMEGTPAIREYVEKHMSALRDCGTLKPIEGLDEYRINFVSQWNQWISGDESPACVAEALRPFLNFSEELLFIAHLNLQDGRNCEKSYAIFVEAFDNGIIQPLHLNAGLYSFETGETCRLRMEQWQPRLFRADFPAVSFSAGTGKPRHIDLEPISPKPILEATVSLKTGNLLAADWFRLPGFTQTIDEGVDFDINSTQGREAQTLHYLSHNVVSVCVGNTSPSLFAHEGCLVVGETSDEATKPEAASAGRILTDFWWATLVEREQLARLIASDSKTSYDDACKIIDAYVADPANNVVALNLEPGEYHLYFGGRHHEFKENFCAEEVSLKGIEPFFVLSDKPLTLKPLSQNNNNRPRL